MIPPKESWFEFSDFEEKLKFMVDHKLVSQSSTYPKTLVYSGGYRSDPTNCTLMGYYERESISVIQIENELHCINTDYLAEMQSGFSSSSAPEKYVVLDLETTGINHNKDKIIEIAAVKYHHGIECDVFEALVNPQCIITDTISAITGIHQCDIVDAPVMIDILPEFKEFIGDLPFVAHNASFDKAFLSDSYAELGYNFSNKSIDTLKLAQKAFPGLESYKLESLKYVLNLQTQVSHRALPDVYTTAALFERCNEQLLKAQTEKIDEKDPASSRVIEAETKPVRTPAKRWNTAKSPKASEFAPTVETIDTSNPLYEKNIVFTGELSIGRAEAMQIAVNCGAIVKSSVSHKTNYLVVGKQDKTLVGDDGLSTKEEYAYKLNGEGKANIVFLNEEQFLQLAKGAVCV